MRGERVVIQNGYRIAEPGIMGHAPGSIFLLHKLGRSIDTGGGWLDKNFLYVIIAEFPQAC